MTTNSPTDGRAGGREWGALAVLSVPALLLSLDLSVLILAMPALTADLQPSGAQSLWITDVYGFTLAGFLVTMGNLGDRIGRRRLLVIGAAAFGAFSVVAAYSTSADMLIIARAALGVAGATLMPSMLALLTNIFRDPRQRGVAISIWTSCFMVGMAIGPLVGGLLLSAFWWGSVFLLGLPVMLLLLILAPVLLPENRNVGAARLDPISVAMSLATILLVVYALQEFAAGGSAAGATLALVLGLVVGVVFVRRQRGLPDPLLDVALLGRPAFGGALAIMLLGGATISGTCLLVNQYWQLVLGLSPLETGLWLIPYALGMIAGYLVTPALAQRFRPAYIIATGMAVSVVGFLLLAQAPVSNGLAITVIGMVIAIGGLSPMVVLGIGLVVGSAPPEKAGAAGSLSQTSNDLGVALGIAVFGSIGTAVYRGRIEVPAGVPADVAASAHEGIAQGTAAAGALPGDIAGTVILAVREAFAGGFSVVAAVCAVLVALLAALALVLFRHEPVGGGAAAPAQEATPQPVSNGEAAG